MKFAIQTHAITLLESILSNARPMLGAKPYLKISIIITVIYCAIFIAD